MAYSCSSNCQILLLFLFLLLCIIERWKKHHHQHCQHPHNSQTPHCYELLSCPALVPPDISIALPSEHPSLRTVKQTLHLITLPPKSCVFVSDRNRGAWRGGWRLFAPYWLILTVAGKPQGLQWYAVGFPLMYPLWIESVINSEAHF